MIVTGKSSVQIIVKVLIVSLVLTFPLASWADEVADKLPESIMTKGVTEFTYNPVGLRDPFAPLVQQMRKTVAKPKRNLGPLEKYQLSQFRLMALLIVQGSPRAMVKAPDGKSYTVKPGDLIGSNSGVVKRIETKVVELDAATGQRIEKSPDRIVVEETGVDSFTGKTLKEERYIEM